MNELQCDIKNEKTGAITASAEYARGVDTLIISTEDEYDEYVEQSSFIHFQLTNAGRSYYSFLSS